MGRLQGLREPGAAHWRPAVEHVAGAALDPAWSPLVLRRQHAVHLLEAEPRAAGVPGRPFAELLPLARRLHAAPLEHAAVLLAADGDVEPDVRAELEQRREARPRT